MTLLFCPALAGLYRCAKLLESLYLSVTTVTATSHRDTVKTGQPKGSPSLVGKSPLVGLWRFLLTLPGILAYGFLAGVNPLAGFDSLIQSAGKYRLINMRFFYACKKLVTPQLWWDVAGEPLRSPGSALTGLSTLLRLTTPFDSGLVRFAKLKAEATAMVATPTRLHPEFTFHFLAVRRADLRDTPHRESVTAPDELTARRLLARDFVLLFAGRVPSQGVRHV
ncbi:host cell division inhibitor Icd-like protein [Serratia oryzae]|uniref:host cell division inhibitor Icd-like protein n=1 Tax=Serratia oryzae TaxID=2034155 RepID=UPI001F5031BD|nr:host cell division inhibitor Icd-like protein [Serratia oryzae]